MARRFVKRVMSVHLVGNVVALRCGVIISSMFSPSKYSSSTQSNFPTIFKLRSSFYGIARILSDFMSGITRIITLQGPPRDSRRGWLVACSSETERLC